MNPAIQNIALNSGRLQPARYARSGRMLIGCAILSASLLMAAAILNFGVGSFFLIVMGLAAVPLIFTIVAYPKTGILILLTAAYVIMFFSRLNSGFPIGTLMDAMVFLMIIGFFLKQKYAQDWGVLKNRISAIVIVWICYNILEVINPAAESIQAWLYSVRAIAFVTLTYFFFQFYIRDVRFIRTIIKLWIFLSLIAALYALKQEYFGFADFEMNSIKSDKLTVNLYFIGNHWRKFSIFSDPVAFAYNMVISSILCFSLITGPVATWKKVTLALLGCLFFFAMLYSGTRGAYVLYPAVYILFSILKYNKKVMALTVLVAIAAVVLIKMPTSNYTLYRFQTAFKPNKDASYILRKSNQKKIQPFIQAHPLGGGVGSTGIWGRRFSPHSYLANFPPDSGYVRIAVELGWIGLFIFCTFMFIVLKTGVTNYFRISDPELKSYCLAAVLIIFALNVGNYPQEAVVQYPINIYFYLAIALVNVTAQLDAKKNLSYQVNK